MAVFRSSGGKKTPGINAGSMSDIIFILLFFFMVTTTYKTATLKVKVSVPGATEVKKLTDKSLVSYIYIGKPVDERKFGTEPRVQLNDSFKEVDDIRDFIAAEREPLNDLDRKKMTISLKIDKAVKMGVVSDVKLALRKASALKINYSAKFDDSYLRR